jgi:DNA-directed RNA polymerase subunit RPC12/RpoP
MSKKVNYDQSIDEENPLPCLNCGSEEFELKINMEGYKCFDCGEDLKSPVVIRREKKKVHIDRDWK